MMSVLASCSAVLLGRVPNHCCLTGTDRVSSHFRLSNLTAPFIVFDLECIPYRISSFPVPLLSEVRSTITFISSKFTQFSSKLWFIPTSEFLL
ncbi:hypothetical protein F5879DRAFT_451358 [Lentinula edodes]|nr:hypothetical protein F5879DRAFT_451358 [Lentinula edodes]